MEERDRDKKPNGLMNAGRPQKRGLIVYPQNIYINRWQGRHSTPYYNYELIILKILTLAFDFLTPVVIKSTNFWTFWGLSHFFGFDMLKGCQNFYYWLV